jgi:FtsP/CotA-like multicopper oxidase with cupredoxin domain
MERGRSTSSTLIRRLLLHFRSFRGPFVFHCHTLEHEDMRMMLTMDPRVTATVSPQPIQAAFP